MRLLRASEDQLCFQLGKQEKRWWLAVLARYPCIPPAHQSLSQSGLLPDPETNQRLLDEALAEQRAENKQQLQALLADPSRFGIHETGWRLFLSPADVEWLLQVLNDVRVGSWIALGSPEGKLEVLNKSNAVHYWAMETAGLFQMELLEALEGGDMRF